MFVDHLVLAAIHTKNSSRTSRVMPAKPPISGCSERNSEKRARDCEPESIVVNE